MKILLTNDDGILADGLMILARTLAAKHDVTVIAPHENRSCCSHSLTVHRKLTYEVCGEYGGIKAYSLNGTPSDCVKFAVHVILDKNLPDLLISGINNLPNLGTDVIYSGTVNAALEGAICGIKSMALSVLHTKNGDYQYISDYILERLEFFHNLLARDTIFNFNFPENPAQSKGVRFTELGIQVYSDMYIKEKNIDDSEHYILTGDRLVNPPEKMLDCDVDLFDEGYATITPMNIQMTNYKQLERLRGKLF